MGYKVFDPFKQYSGALDLEKGWEYPGSFSIASYYLIVRPEPAGPFGKNGVVFGGGTGSTIRNSSIYSKVIPEYQPDLCMSVDFRLGSAGYVATTVFMMTDTKTSREGKDTAAGTLSLEIVNRVPKVYHTIVTFSGTSSYSVNKLLLGEFSQLVAGESYTLQMRGKIVDQQHGEATIILNGQTMDVMFNPTRVTPAVGYEQLGFNAISTSSYRSSTAVANETLVSDLVIYTHDAETPWPLGPIDLKIKQTPDANLAVGPVNEATFVTVNGTLEFDVEDPVGEIIGAAVMTRANAVNGNVAVGFQVDVVNGTEVTRVVDRNIIPGFLPKIDTAFMDPALFQAGTKLRLRSIPR